MANGNAAGTSAMTLRRLLEGLSAHAQRRVSAGDEPLVALRSAIDLLAVAAMVADDAGQYLLTNAPASSLTEYSARELRRLWVWDITPNSNKPEFELVWRAFLQQREQHGEYPLVTKSGRVVTTDYAARANVLPHFHVSVLRLRSRVSGKKR
jgi:PAS domain S-box-containing protein